MRALVAVVLLGCSGSTEDPVVQKANDDAGGETATVADSTPPTEDAAADVDGMERPAKVQDIKLCHAMIQHAEPGNQADLDLKRRITVAAFLGAAKSDPEGFVGRALSEG